VSPGVRTAYPPDRARVGVLVGGLVHFSLLRLRQDHELELFLTIEPLNYLS
jgi:hypothetical protein